MVYLLSFFSFMLYNYYGDNMNSSDVIVSIKSMKDISNITQNTKYINISIDSVDTDVIDYFLLNGSVYSYADTINNRNGYIYANYDMFKLGESIITNIIDNVPSNITKLEMIRYIYIYLGKILCIDINTMSEKNETVSFNKISTINNVWGSLSKNRINDIVVSKIFMYICSRMNIKCELISSNIKGNIANKVYLDDTFLIVDLFNDIHNIQGGFSTRYFDKFNDNIDMDKKLSYIKDNYMEYYVDKVLKNLDYTKEDTLYEILSLTSSVIDISNIGPFELFKIYRDILDKYVPNYDIKINNLFIYNGVNSREHFTLFSYNDSYYSFNYSKGMFIKVDESILYDNIKSKRIGIYDDEDFMLREKGMVL